MSKHWGETWDENHPHSELTGTIIAAAIRVQKALGPGLLEDAYKACLAHALHQEGHQVYYLIPLRDPQPPQRLSD